MSFTTTNKGIAVEILMAAGCPLSVEPNIHAVAVAYDRVDKFLGCWPSIQEIDNDCCRGTGINQSGNPTSGDVIHVARNTGNCVTYYRPAHWPPHWAEAARELGYNLTAAVISAALPEGHELRKTWAMYAPTSCAWGLDGRQPAILTMPGEGAWGIITHDPGKGEFGERFEAL